jgi:hypothetical protein
MGLLFVYASPPDTSHPQIDHLRLQRQDAEVLLALHDIHQLANDGSRLLGWSVLLDFAETIPASRKPRDIVTEAVMKKLMDITVSARARDWESLQQRFQAARGLQRIAALKSIELCEEREIAHRSDRQARAFWTALRLSYVDIERRLSSR